MRRWIGALLVLAACSSGSAGSSPGSPSPVTFGHGTAVVTRADGTTLSLPVEIADTEAALERGLMFRTHLDQDAGMAFLFDVPKTASFYMKDTLIPLSIAFFDGGGTIVAVDEMTPCHTDPCPLTPAPSPVAGAVEANARYFETHGVQPGDRIEVHAA